MVCFIRCIDVFCLVAVVSHCDLVVVILLLVVFLWLIGYCAFGSMLHGLGVHI